MTVGSRPAWIRTAATIEVVVVFPWLPATAIPNFRRISSASSSPRGITGSPRRRASTTSGLSGRTAELTTTAFAPATFAAGVPFVDDGPEHRQTFGDGGELRVGSADAITQFEENFGQSAHADSTDTDEVDRLRLEKHFINVLFRLLSAVSIPSERTVYRERLQNVRRSARGVRLGETSGGLAHVFEQSRLARPVA